MRIPGALLLALLLGGCRPERTAPEQFAGVRAELPDWPERKAEGDPGAGSLWRAQRGQGRVLLSWEADPRSGLPSGEEALLAAALGSAATLSQAARREQGKPAPGAPEVDGHPAALVEAEGAQALVWRCDKTGRLLRLLREGRGPPLEQLAASVRCHHYGDKPVNGDVPAASVSALGPQWRLAKRNPASAGWLTDDAVLTIFAGQLSPLPADLVEAAHLAPAWALAAGLRAPEVLSGVRASGPQGHPAIRFDGEATLDGQPVRFRFLWWRCQARGRSYGALVVTRAAAGTPAPPAGEWTGRDAALLAARCHG